jgi:hypothetical protein
MDSQPLPSRDELMRQYEIGIDLYKDYLKLVIELNVFYYAITGAIISYYFAHNTDPMMRWALMLPFVMSILFACFFVYGGIQQMHYRAEVFRIRDALGFRVAPEMLVLSIFLYIFSLLMVVVAVGLGYIMLSCQFAT